MQLIAINLEVVEQLLARINLKKPERASNARMKRALELSQGDMKRSALSRRVSRKPPRTLHVRNIVPICIAFA